MFSNDVNARDLFFSNPIDHFLAQDQEIKTSFESGFSSSHNQTGTSKEMQYRSSQDIFSQTKSQDLFSQNERTSSQYGTKNLDYQKYISQNLLLGKESPRSFLSFNDREETRKEKPDSPLTEKEIGENHVNEIRKFLDTLNDNVKKLNSEVGLQNNNLQEELLRLKEKLSFVEKTIGQKVELIADNCKSFPTIIKKEENEKKELYNKISEVAECVKNLENKIEDYAENNNKMLQETIKKISKNYEVVHKKQLQKMQDQYSHIEKTAAKKNSAVESSIKSIENLLDQKLDSIKNTIHQFVQLSGQRGADSLIDKQISQSRICDLSKNVFDCNKYKKSMPMSNYDSDYNYKNSNVGISEIGQTSPMHTPLSNFLKKYKNNEDPVQKYQLRSTIKPEASAYKDTISYSNLRIRRKPSTPLRKMISPKFRKPMQNIINSHCTPLISKFTSNNICNETLFHRNETGFSKEKYEDILNKTKYTMISRSSPAEKYEDILNKTKYTMISSSSPALTVVEAATIAKHSYAYHHRHMYNK